MSARMPMARRLLPFASVPTTPVPATPVVTVKPSLLKLLGDNLARPELLKAKFRMHVQVMPDGGKFACKA